MLIIHHIYQRTYVFLPLGRKNRHTLIYIWKLLNVRNWTEWMKGICHIWSRGRHFSPSLPGDRYLNLGSKSDLRAEISGSIVWYDALAPRPEVLFSFYAFYANNVLFFLFLHKNKWAVENLVICTTWGAFSSQFFKQQQCGFRVDSPMFLALWSFAEKQIVFEDFPVA